jgi:hypothetical protein
MRKRNNVEIIKALLLSKFLSTVGIILKDRKKHRKNKGLENRLG